MPADRFFAVWRHQNFRFEQKKGAKKGQCVFFGGGKRKKGRAKEKGYLKCTYQKWKLFVLKGVKEKNNNMFFSPKKKPSRFAQCSNLWFRLTPPANTFRLARKWAFWKSAWLLATLKDLGYIKKSFWKFFRPPWFLEIPIFGANFCQKKHNNNKDQKRAGHPSFWRFHWEDRSNKLFASSQAMPCGAPTPLWCLLLPVVKSQGPALKSVTLGLQRCNPYGYMSTLWDDPPTIQVLQNEHDFLAQRSRWCRPLYRLKQTPVLLLKKIVGEIGIFSPFLLAVFLHGLVRHLPPMKPSGPPGLIST